MIRQALLHTHRYHLHATAVEYAEYPQTIFLTFVVVLDAIGGAESRTSQPLDHVVLNRKRAQGEKIRKVERE